MPGALSAPGIFWKGAALKQKIEGAIRIVFKCFLAAMIVLLPFFFWEGYTLIATRKHLMFLWICRISFGILIFLTLWLLFLRRRNVKKPRLSVTDLLVLIWIAAGVLTFFLSDYRLEAWRGFFGWNMGLRTSLYCVLIYFYTSRLFSRKKVFLVMALVASGLVILWGGLNRVGIRVMPMEFAEPGFIGSIGNINWFAGYFSAFFPAGVVVLLLTKNLFARIAAGVYTAVGVWCVFVEGSDSIYLPILVTAAFGWYLFFRFVWKNGEGKRYFLRWILPVGFLAAGVLLIVLIVVNTANPGALGALSDHALFTFDDSWGSYRGLNYRIGAAVFSALPGLRKLFGVGQDCFGYIVYDNPVTGAVVQEMYGEAVLANTHNELLTSVVNIGLVGTGLFLATGISSIVRVLRMKEADIFALAAAACLLSYLFHNLVSFEQVLNFPFFFLWMGVAEASKRANE